MKNKTLCILSCTSKKFDGEMEARLLYAKSNFFKKCKLFCQKNNYNYVIISALYGLIEPKTIIQNYDKALKNKKDIKKIQNDVIEKLQLLLPNYDKIIVLCGQKYIETFKPLINKNFQFPMKGMSIGHRLQWLGEQIK